MSAPTVLASPGSLLEMHMPKPYPDLVNEEFCGCGPAALYFNKPLGASDEY